jgi:DNA (cytosine-5)-methyltransferase 1
MGLHRSLPHARIIGFDIRPQPHYPFEFQLADALTVELEPFDFVWASPPCQRYSAATNGSLRPRASYSDALPQLLASLRATSKPYIVENVPRAPLPHLVTLCGTMFGLPLYRHRIFASSHLILAPAHIIHRGPAPTTIAGHFAGGLAAASVAMGIDWMSRRELVEAVPPAYAEYLVSQLSLVDG